MKSCFTIIAALMGLAAIIAQGTTLGQAPAPRPASPGDLGPGDGGATLKQPWMEAPAKSNQPPANSLQNLWNPATTSQNNGSNQFMGNANFLGKVVVPPSNPTEMNRDIELTDKHGNWVIFLIAYSGAKAPQLARKCVIEMRTNPKYKLNAFVYNYGAEEKRKEYERVQKLRAKLKAEQEQVLKREGVQDAVVMPIRVRVEQFDEQTGVLISGNFKTREEAQEALKSIRKLPEPDPRKIDMDMISNFVEELAELGAGKTPRLNQNASKRAYISPFVNAFAARNPCLSKETQNSEQQKLDMVLLRELNAREPLSLLKCPKMYTLVVKQYNTRVMLQDGPKLANGFAGNQFTKHESEDYAAKNAASLAELLRRGGCGETYILHAKYCSYVTVGGFDQLSDPSLLGMQAAIQHGFRTLAADARYMEFMKSLDLPTQLRPMVIPH